jgi:hypothetical protein
MAARMTTNPVRATAASVRKAAPYPALTTIRPAATLLSDPPIP